MRSLVAAIKHWFNHDWTFDSGEWIIRDVSVTVRRCQYEPCGLKQEIHHYHLIPNYTPGQCGQGISTLHAERRPGDKDYDKKYDSSKPRPT